MAEIDLEGPLDLEAATMQWINNNKDPTYLYRGPIYIIRYHISTLLNKALNIARAARLSHDAYREVFARTIAEMNRLKTMAMEADEIPEDLKDRGTTLAFGYSTTFNEHFQGMECLTPLYGMTNASDFLWESLFETRKIPSGGGRTGSVIRNLAIALRILDMSKDQSTEAYLSDWNEIENLWPVEMLDTVNRYYEWTQREAQAAMLWADMVLFIREVPDGKKVVDWRLPVDGEGN